MILLVSVIAGLMGGLARAWIGKRRLQVPELRHLWLVPAAFLPQWLAFYFPATRTLIPNELASAALVGSQLILLVVAWSNRRLPGFWILGAGLALNLTVITLNGGLMPITPETANWIYFGAPNMPLVIGERVGTGKDILLAASSTRLAWLSDCLLLPAWFPCRMAFSPGDVLIAIGAFWFLWRQGDVQIKRHATEQAALPGYQNITDTHDNTNAAATFRPDARL